MPFFELLKLHEILKVVTFVICYLFYFCNIYLIMPAVSPAYVYNVAYFLIDQSIYMPKLV